MPCHARHVNNTCCLTNKPWFLRQPGDLFRDIQSCWRVAAIWFNTEMLLRTCRSDRGTYRYRRCAGPMQRKWKTRMQKGASYITRMEFARLKYLYENGSGFPARVF